MGVTKPYLTNKALAENLTLTWEGEHPVLEGKEYKDIANASAAIQRLVRIRKRKELVLNRAKEEDKCMNRKQLHYGEVQGIGAYG